MKRTIIKGKLAKIIGVRLSERVVNVVTGVSGSGKTFQTKRILKKYARRFPKEKILILDTHNEYTEYKKIQPKQIKTFKKPSRIVLSEYNFSEVMPFLWEFTGGVLVVETSGMLVQKNDLEKLQALLSFPRTKDFDSIVIGMSLDSYPFMPKLFQNTSVFRFHRSISISSKLSDISPFAKVAQDAVDTSCTPMNKKNGRKFGYYDAVNQKILGVGSSDLTLAVFHYFKPQMFALAKQLSSYGEDK